MARLNPLSINLKELPPEGHEFQYSEQTGELTPQLKDLIGTNPYAVSLTVTPAGNTFTLKGSLKAKMDLQCSLCAVDFKFPIDLSLNELLVVMKKQPLGKGDHQTKANHAHEWAAQGPDYILLESDVFNVGDYLHEMVALAEPLRPLGKPDCDKNCENLAGRERRPWLSYGDEPETDHKISPNPFQVLEKIKLKG
jgi:uncharacterized protein